MLCFVNLKCSSCCLALGPNINSQISTGPRVGQTGEIWDLFRSQKHLRTHSQGHAILDSLGSKGFRRKGKLLNTVQCANYCHSELKLHGINQRPETGTLPLKSRFECSFLTEVTPPPHYYKRFILPVTSFSVN